MKINCPIPLSGPSALHAALFEDGGLNEHIAQCHPEEGPAMTNSTPEVPPLSAEEIAEAHAVYAKQQAKGDYRGSFDSVREMELLDPARLLATIAAKGSRLMEAEATIEQMAVLAFNARSGANTAIYRVEECAETYQRRAALQSAQKENE